MSFMNMMGEPAHANLHLSNTGVRLWVREQFRRIPDLPVDVPTSNLESALE